MNLSVGYLLGIVLLAVVCGTVLGSPLSPMTTTISSAESSSDTSINSNANTGMLANNYDDVLGELVKGLSVCQDPFIYNGVTYCKSSDDLQFDDVSFSADSSLGCLWNGAVYQDGDVNTESCMHMKCNNGVWEYTGQMNKDCGNCTVHGDPHFWTFDDTKFLEYGHKYELRGLGTFVITQNGIIGPSFELNANFAACNEEHKAHLSCVQSITYRELGIEVQLVLPLQLNISDPKAEIMVLVNGEVQKFTSGVKSAEAFSGTDGTVLVFEHNHIEEEANFFCMNIVGSQGLSMSLCQHEMNFAWLYVLPMPTLKNKLYGLCNTYTGAPQNHLIARNGIDSTKIVEFADSWRSSCSEVGGRCQGIHETCNGVIDRGLGCSQQVCCIERKGCELDNIHYEDGEFNDNTCFTMQCRNGAWEYADQINKQCSENCTVEEGPYFNMFDNTTFLASPPGNKYQYGAKGDYVITQDELSNPSFGLNATFETCHGDFSANLTCVTNISYYEPGITVKVSLPNNSTETTIPVCTKQGHNPSADSNCQFTVKIDDEEVRPTGRAMSIQATFGSVLIFTNNHIQEDADRFCMNIVGSRGLSVSLCQHESSSSVLYVFPMPNLKPMPTLESNLYGLCNTYTGHIQGNFTGKMAHVIHPTPLLTTDITDFASSWKVKPEKLTQNISQEV